MKHLAALALFLGTSACAQVPSVPIPEGDYAPEKVLESGQIQIVVQHGRFNCPEGQHRAILVSESAFATMACATLEPGRLTMDTEGGKHIVLQVGNKGDIQG